MNESKDNMNLYATGFMGNNMTYKDLISSSDRFAQAFHNAGIKEGDNVAILTISMPIVQQCLLSLSKIGATMSWIDLRTKAKDLVKYINNGNCKTVVVFEDVLPLLQSIIDETDIERVIISSPKDYLSPIVKVLANIKDMKEGKKKDTPNDPRFIRFNDFIKDIKKVNGAMAQEGMPLTKELKTILHDCYTGKSTFDTERKKMIDKYRKIYG